MSRGSKGPFVALEGLDGAGTTTQLECLAVALKERGRAVLTTREPSDGPVGMLLRQALTGRLTLARSHAPLAEDTLALLFAADRTDHLISRVLPALEQGQLVLCDRYVLSSLAYQGATLPMAWVEALNQTARRADLTLFLQVDVETAARRRAARGGAEELFDAREKQQRIAQQYERALKSRSVGERIVRIDGEQSREKVTADCLAAIEALVP